MNIFTKIQKHAAMASGNFERLFKGVDDIPPLPAAASRFLAEINRPEPEISQLETILSSIPGLAAKIIRTVNSALFSLRSPVTSIRHALSLMGMKKIREIALAYTVMYSLPEPDNEHFDQEALWIDAVVMAVFAKILTARVLPGQEDEAFVSALLADLALPVLLTVWSEYYEPILDEWMSGEQSLSEIERKHFRWDHAQAGAWVVKSWNFSDEMICLIGAHNLSYEKLSEAGLLDTPALPIAAAGRVPSILRSGSEHRNMFVDTAAQWLDLSIPDFKVCVQEVKNCLDEVFMLFDLPDRGTGANLDSLMGELCVKETEA